MAKFTVEVTVPEGLTAGDTFSVEVEAPAKEKKPRGQLAGIALEDMTDEQLKRELINAKSVLYKAKQRGASEEAINANQERVNRAEAEKAKRQPVTATASAVASVVEEGSTEADSEEVYNAETADEI